VYPPAVPFWEDINQLMKYDMVLLACAGVNSATNPFNDNNYISATAKNAWCSTSMRARPGDGRALPLGVDQGFHGRQ